MPLFEPGKVFFSKWLKYAGTDRNIPIRVVSVDPDNDKLTVDWGAGSGPEEWILSHCENAFNGREYQFLTFNTCPYDLSKDYDMLYEMISFGYKVVCWATCDWEGDSRQRDICVCEKKEKRRRCLFCP